MPADSHSQRPVPSRIERTDFDDTICPDKKTVCLKGTSCCRNKNKSFSCCPIVKAVCCSDFIHCCPDGWKCDIEQGVLFSRTFSEAVSYCPMI